MPDFLLEIGCEEIPARMIDAASQELRDRVSALLARERLAASEISNFDTPRRLAVIASGIPATQPDVTEQVNGPSASIAYKDGQPTPAAHAFAKKAGVEVSQLEKVTTRERRIPLCESHSKRPDGGGNSRGESSQRNLLHLLAEKYVLAETEREVCASGSLAGGHARR